MSTHRSPAPLPEEKEELSVSEQWRFPEVTGEMQQRGRMQGQPRKAKKQRCNETTDQKKEQQRMMLRTS